jgi:hypothetical protein
VPFNQSTVGLRTSLATGGQPSLNLLPKAPEAVPYLSNRVARSYDYRLADGVGLAHSFSWDQ